MESFLKLYIEIDNLPYYNHPSAMSSPKTPRAIASGFPFIHAAQWIPGDAKTDNFAQSQRNIPLLLLKKVDAIALTSDH
jgi:hypothetical protein